MLITPINYIKKNVDTSLYTEHVYIFKGVNNNSLSNSYFIWDFGDPYATNDNPNFIVVHNIDTTVSHKYYVPGKYVVRLIEKRIDNIIIETTYTVKISAG